MKRVSILGSTGSIGKKTVDLLLKKRRKYQVEVLSTHSNFALLAHQAKSLSAKYVAISNERFYKDLKECLLGTGIKVEVGAEGLANVASLPIDLSVVAIAGIAGLEPVMHIIESGTKVIALANKESIVCGGKLLLKKAKEKNVQIIPIDSEHNAIFQVLQNDDKCVEKIILTASGGPFLNHSLEQLRNVIVDQALNHPIWNMGKKISIDSATMMNKALEIIEAHSLFNISPNKVEAVVHPESIIHGVVVYKDGFNFAVLAEADMTVPISYALSWPERSALSYKLDLTKQKKLTFQEPDYKRFPALKLSMEVLNSSLPHINSIVLNAANEVAVNEFLKSRIGFLGIVKVVESTIENFDNYINISSLPDIINIDHESRVIAKGIIACKTLTYS
ncbi:1-deoxy-D-xylulose-5-phosphate reductoisomerase [Wolbachia endosymbiont of Dirofilaria (Dirofilaria) immitis]|uniref:1-deoxy-D-xylulose 5-phosphate reductoisomerase n=1 Tax=Wolbachia endosymbiont of Dirofilaria immitis TaxID=82301 RepID=A8KQP1_9RICK|nr:1-deoxy-D-xylulose-5-phosphate reductoisomerase [Wolbachia endosymbiont of Dirofilaria (Dirofilaria) immitis]QKX02302.1 1-deoxy-D-xylulose-5-phosphate reductoisomerase [Wolbachia endosymbiont of Dirofilaria (Dirofilaria) immitis]CAP05191.1 putative 1-deoxy-D-xylulose 5-phosphate reductoisomerase [Wolbachia endosymbiont of Dirofilaria immitis]CAP10752.1 1-deoxy-D-xylulose 5-phosphate reductoisomerase [Wolbachia endosymbiont of Dirofilaria immitis]